MSWYKNTSIWSAVIAASALLLSQFPPITQWAEVQNIDIKFNNRLGLNNAVGIVGYTMLLDLKNEGNRPITISKIDLEITPEGSAAQIYNAEFYNKILPNNPQPISYPITSIALQPDESWIEQVSFNPVFKPSDEEKLNELRLRIAQEIWENPNPNQRALTIASVDAVSPAEEFFEKRFDLEKGQYKASVNVYLEDSETSYEKKFEFIVYDYQIETIKSQVNDYKFGAGIYYPVNNLKSVWAKITNIK